MAAPLTKRRRTESEQDFTKPKFTQKVQVKSTTTTTTTSILKKPSKPQNKGPTDSTNPRSSIPKTSDKVTQSTALVRVENNDDDNDEPNLNDISSGSNSEDNKDEDNEDENSDDYGDSSESDPDDIDDLVDAQLSKKSTDKKRKRDDPDAFSTSMSKILASHLTTSARKDPILVRSKKQAQDIDASRLETKARRLLTLERKKEMDQDRVKDVIPKGDVDGEEIKMVMEREKALRKIAQRGVVKLFNAVRAAQIKGEEAMKDSKAKRVVGIDTRDSKVNEMSKQGFLDLIQTGGKTGK